MTKKAERQKAMAESGMATLKKRKEKALSLSHPVVAKSIKDVITDLVSQVPPMSEIPESMIATIMELEDTVGQKLTRQQLMVHALVNRAMQGSVDAFRELVDRTEGKVANKNENKNMNINYEDWLKSQAGITPEETIDDE